MEKNLAVQRAISKGRTARCEQHLQEAVAEMLDAMLPPYTWTHPNPNTYRGFAGVFLAKNTKHPVIRTALQRTPGLKAAVATLIKRFGMQGRKEGTRAGVPDILIWLPTVDAPQGMAIELKYGKGRTSKEQQAYLLAMERCGIQAVCCRSIDTVYEALLHYGYGDLP